jgi:F0F1-type ATP synthase membrane subunit b/b'
MNSSRTAVRRWQMVGVGAVAVALVGVGLGVASAEESVPTVNCPAVAGKIGAVPAQAQAEIQRNLALLNTQISEANKRLASTVGQGGPNFIQNAILGPLKDKRVATINRMATAIGRNAAKPNLDVQGLATCSLNQNGGGVAAPEPTAVRTTAPAAGGGNGNSSGGSAPTVSCPAVAGALGSIPAQAKAEIERNLALLNTQISEANNRLASTVGQGGANFIQNAILGPLKDKRVATINRMATAIGRNAAKPNLNVQALATCSLNQNGGGNAAPEPTVVATAAPAAGNGNGAAPTVNCPAVTGLPAIPAQAQAEVARNLQLLNTQITEANNRLASTVGQGGPNFIQNAILGPLEDKRVATLNRIETAIGRNAARPEGLERFAPCSLND